MERNNVKPACLADGGGRRSRRFAWFAAPLILALVASGCPDDAQTSSATDTGTSSTVDASGMDVAASSDAPTETSAQDTASPPDGVAGADRGNGNEDAAPTNEFDYAGESNLGSCGPNPSDTARYAVIGFWKSSDCSGEPMKTNAFPINDTAGCYCWPGNSGENSADSFACDPEAKTVTIIQYNSLTCGAGDNTPTTKTFHLDKCEQDIPPTLYSKVVDMGPCTN